MLEAEKKSTEVELFVSKVLYNYFDKYRRGINFLDAYTETRKPQKQSRGATIAFVLLYCAVVIACAVVLFAYYWQTSKAVRETNFIEPRINTSEEKRLKGELEQSRVRLSELESLNRLYEQYENEYETLHILTDGELRKLFDAASPNVNLLSVVYSRDNKSVTLECETDSPTVPREYVKQLKQAFPEASFDYFGYTVNQDEIKFNVLCHIH